MKQTKITDYFYPVKSLNLLKQTKITDYFHPINSMK